MIDITAFSDTSVDCTNTLVKIINNINDEKLEKHIYKIMNGFHDKLIALDCVDKQHREYYSNLMFEKTKSMVLLYDLNKKYDVEIESYLLCTLTSIIRKDKVEYQI